MKKKKSRFDVDLRVLELSNISFVSGTFYCKTRLLSGGDYTEQTPRKDVVNHCVKWNAAFRFSCKLSSAPSGVLDTALCRISVRKELKGGKSQEKFGYVDVNLAECAGAGTLSRRYLVRGYENKKHRQDNSILNIMITMQLTSGDPLFKPQVSAQDHFLPHGTSQDEPSRRQSAESRRTSDATIGATSSSSLATCEQDELSMRRVNSESRTESRSDSPSLHHRSPSSGSNKVFAASWRTSSVEKSPMTKHQRNISSGSNKLFIQAINSRTSSTEMRSSASGGGIMSHSRQSSNSTSDSACADLDTFHITSPGQPRTSRGSREVQMKIGATRVDNDDIINELTREADLLNDSNVIDEGIGMSMFLERDGVSTMSKIETRKRTMKPIPIEDRFKTL